MREHGLPLRARRPAWMNFDFIERCYEVDEQIYDPESLRGLIEKRIRATGVTHASRSIFRQDARRLRLCGVGDLWARRQPGNFRASEISDRRENADRASRGTARCRAGGGGRAVHCLSTCWKPEQSLLFGEEHITGRRPILTKLVNATGTNSAAFISGA